MRNSLRMLLLVLAAALAAPAIAQQKGTSDMDILREKLKADQKQVVAANIALTDAEAKAFWPIYEAYQADLQKINLRLGNTILAFADAQEKGSVPNETAKKLLEEAIAIDEAEAKLKRTYLPKLHKALPAIKVARYIQIENKIRAVIRYEMAAGIPLAK